MKHIVVIFLFALCALTGCGKKKQSAQAPVPHLPVFVVSVDSLPHRMQFTGQTSSIHNVIIQPRISGYLQSIEFRSGMPVRKGQLLFRIDPSQLATSLASARSQLLSAKAQSLEAKNNYERAVPLARINAISQTSLDQYTAQYESAKASVRAAEAAVKDASLNVGYATIYSPMDGIIASSSASVGDYVGVGTQYTTLTTISDNDTIQVTLSVPVNKYLLLARRDSGKVHSYDNSTLLSDITLWLPDGSRYPHRGVYAYTASDAQNLMGTIAIVVSFPNPDNILKAGQYAHVTADAGGLGEKIAIPQRCVMQTQDVNSVWVVGPDSTVSFRKVVLGDTFDGDMWIIEQGLWQGEMVLTSGLQKVKSGEKIVPVVKNS